MKRAHRKKFAKTFPKSIKLSTRESIFLFWSQLNLLQRTYFEWDGVSLWAEKIGTCKCNPLEKYSKEKLHPVKNKGGNFGLLKAGRLDIKESEICIAGQSNCQHRAQRKEATPLSLTLSAPAAAGYELALCAPPFVLIKFSFALFSALIKTHARTYPTVGDQDNSSWIIFSSDELLLVLIQVPADNH